MKWRKAIEELPPLDTPVLCAYVGFAPRISVLMMKESPISGDVYWNLGADEDIDITMPELTCWMPLPDFPDEMKGL